MPPCRSGWPPAWPANFDGTVDALHLPVGPAGGMVGGLAMSGEAMPLIMNIDDERLEARAKESERAYKEIVAPIKGATYTAAKTATLDTLVAMGRCSDICWCWAVPAPIRRTWRRPPSRPPSTNAPAPS